MAKKWKVIGVEVFKGEEYIKMEVEGDTSQVFGKKHANISSAQMAAVLEHFGILDLEQFAGVQAK